MTRFREDDRFKSVTPESMVMSSWTSAGLNVGIGAGPHQNAAEQEGEIWVDWAFVDFWKSNHCEFRVVLVLRDWTDRARPTWGWDRLDTVQRGLSADPNVLSASSSSGTSS